MCSNASTIYFIKSLILLIGIINYFYEHNLSSKHKCRIIVISFYSFSSGRYII